MTMATLVVMTMITQILHKKRGIFIGPVIMCSVIEYFDKKRLLGKCPQILFQKIEFS